jgi:hypothetical protein
MERDPEPDLEGPRLVLTMLKAVREEQAIRPAVTLMGGGLVYG